MLRKLSVLSRAPHKALASRHSDSSAAADKRNRMYLDLADDDYLFDDEEEEETLSEEPPAAALQRRRRRRALVPPKLITDGYESCTEGFDESGSKSRSKFSSSGLGGGSGQLSPSGRSGSVNNLATDNADNDASDQDQITVLGGSLTPTSKSAVSSKQNLSIMDELGGTSQSGEQRHLTPNVTIEGIEGDTSENVAGKGPLRKEGIGIRSIPKFGGSPSSPNRVRASNSGSSGSGGSATSNYLGVNHGSRNRRRSSVVVIPPMQICPGDLLVYSKVLSQRSNMIGRCNKTLSL